MLLARFRPVALALALACSALPLVPAAIAAAPPADPLAAGLDADLDEPDIPAEDAGRPFVLAPPHDSIPAEQGIVFFGDAGSGTRAQALVARRIAEFCATSKCDGVVLLGDNFYPKGVASKDDPLWQSRFLDIYGGLGLPFHPALGNHDYLGDPDAEVGWQAPPGTASTWSLPARHYTWDLGPVRLIALDTNQLDRAQKRWFKQVLPLPNERASSTQAAPTWTIVYGHHPLWSGGAHGDTPELRGWARLLDRADFYLCGHDHDQQVIARPGLVEVVMGSGGAELRANHAAEGSRLARSGFGFGYLAIRGETAEVVVVGIDGSIVGRFPFTHETIEGP